MNILTAKNASDTFADMKRKRKARAVKIPRPVSEHMAAIGRRGGLARGSKTRPGSLTDEQRSAIASNAAIARKRKAL